MLHELFPTPIWIKDCHGQRLATISAEIDQALEQINIDRRPWDDLAKSTFDQSGVNDIQRLGLTELETWITANVQEYAQSAKAVGDLVLTESWFNRYDQGDFMFDHCHSHCKISGVYYYLHSEGQGDLRFVNPVAAQWLGLWPGDNSNNQGIEVPVKQGRLILFPSWLTHRVCPNQLSQAQPRISISFNFR